MYDQHDIKGHSSGDMNNQPAMHPKMIGFDEFKLLPLFAIVLQLFEDWNEVGMLARLTDSACQDGFTNRFLPGGGRLLRPQAGLDQLQVNSFQFTFLQVIRRQNDPPMSGIFDFALRRITN